MIIIIFKSKSPTERNGPRWDSARRLAPALLRGRREPPDGGIRRRRRLMQKRHSTQIELNAHSIVLFAVLVPFFSGQKSGPSEGQTWSAILKLKRARKRERESDGKTKHRPGMVQVYYYYYYPIANSICVPARRALRFSSRHLSPPTALERASE